MRLIALKNFLRVGTLKDLKIETPHHEKQISKGIIFEIGEAVKFDDFKKGDPNRQLIAQLSYCGCVAPADGETVAKVQAEIAAEQEAERRHKARMTEVGMAADANLLVAVLGQLAQQQKSISR